MKNLLLLLAAVLSLSAVHGVAEPLKVGDDAPACALLGTDGRGHNERYLKGHPAVVIACVPTAYHGGVSGD